MDEKSEIKTENGTGAEAEDIKKCAYCGKECDIKKTLYRIRHEGKFYCFCSQEHKTEFQKKKFGDVLY